MMVSKKIYGYVFLTLFLSDQIRMCAMRSSAMSLPVNMLTTPHVPEASSTSSTLMQSSSLGITDTIAVGSSETPHHDVPTISQSSLVIEPSTSQTDGFQDAPVISGPDTTDDRPLILPSVGRNITKETSRSIFMTLIIISLSICSVLVNGLSIVVHSRMSVAIATILIAVCVSDILQGTATAVLAATSFFDSGGSQAGTMLNRSGLLVRIVIRRCLILYLDRVSLALNVLISIDRFIVLSNTLGLESFVQKSSKTVVVTVYTVLIGVTLLDAYCAYLLKRDIEPEVVNVTFTGVRKHTDFTGSTDINGSSFYQSISTRPPTDDHTAEDNSIKDTFNGLGAEKQRETTVTPEGYKVTTDIERSSYSTEQHLKTSTQIIQAKEHSRNDDYESVNTNGDDDGFNSTSLGPLNGTNSSRSIILIRMCALSDNVLMYVLLLIMAFFNLVTHGLLKYRAVQRRQLGTTRKYQRNNHILVVMTTTYVIVALPITTLTLVVDMQVFHGFNIEGELRSLFLKIVWGASLCTQLRNISDFVVFFGMSPVFRRNLKSSLRLRKSSVRSSE